MSLLRALLALTLWTTLGLGSCENWDGTPPEIVGLIGGTVFSPDSVPVAGAMIEVVFDDIDCASSDDDVFVDETVSEADGSYIVHFRSYETFAAPCLGIRARPAAASGSAPSPLVLIDVAPGDDDIRVTVDLYLAPD